jgi:hypothetical protein
MEATNKKLDQFTKEVIQDAGLASPSTDFLANVMAEVSLKPISTEVYKPLISKVGWVIIASLLVIFAFALSYFSLGFSILGDWNLSSLAIEKFETNVEIPVTYAYCFFFLLVFVLIQVKLIRRQLDKRFHNLS